MGCRVNIKFISTLGYDFYCEPCTTVSGEPCGPGSIELEFGWQLVAIPISRGYWDNITHAHIHDEVTVAKFKNYVLDQITDLYGAGVVERASTYPGDDNRFWTYVVGSTPEGDSGNFQLVYDDGVHKEISGFWIKIIGGAAPYIITWG